MTDPTTTRDADDKLSDLSWIVIQLFDRGATGSSITLRREPNPQRPGGYSYWADYRPQNDDDCSGVGDTPVGAINDLFFDMLIK